MVGTQAPRRASILCSTMARESRISLWAIAAAATDTAQSDRQCYEVHRARKRPRDRGLCRHRAVRHMRLDHGRRATPASAFRLMPQLAFSTNSAKSIAQSRGGIGGSGLGLAISRSWSRAWAERSGRKHPGNGSTFCFDILFKEAPCSPNRSVGSSGTSRRNTRVAMRILLVEDNGTNRLVASRMVERMGHGSTRWPTGPRRCRPCARRSMILC